MMRVVLVDDEQPTRNRLRQMLSVFPDLEIVGEAEDGELAIERILELRPDLVFLDIQMPGCSGLEVASSLPLPRPRIIFCTAFDQYAVDAFELHAIDYLLKPVNRARLAKSVEHARGMTAAESDAAIDKALRRAAPGRFLAKRGSRFRVVAAGEVVYFSSEDGLTLVHTSGESCWMEPSLSELEQRLDSAAFFRVSRMAIVKLDCVAEVIPASGGCGEVVLKNGVRLEVSRRRFQELLAALSEG